MAKMIVAHPLPGFSGRVAVEEFGLSFIGGFTGPVEVPAHIQTRLTGAGYTLNANPASHPGNEYVLEADLSNPASPASVALRAAFERRRLTLYNPAGLDKWRVALGNRRTSPVRVLVEGNSNWEGTGAADFAQRLPVVLNAELRARYGLTGAANPYVTRSYITPAPTNAPYTISGTVGTSQFGLGARGWSIAEGGGTITVPFTGDRVRVNYIRGGAAGIITLVLDGGAPVTINTVNASETGGQWDSGVLTRGPHTLVISRDPSSVSTRQIYINGVETYDGDFTSGIRVYDAGKHGLAAATLAASPHGERHEYPLAGPFGLIILGLGENDGAVTKAAYKTSIEAILTRYRGYGFTGSFLLCHGPLPGGGFDSTRWDEFGAAEREIAEASTDVAALDLSASIPGYATGNALGIYADTKHNNSAGQAWRADLVRAALVPA